MSSLPAGTVLARVDDLAEGVARAVDLNAEEFPPLTALLVLVTT